MRIGFPDRQNAPPVAKVAGHNLRSGNVSKKCVPSKREMNCAPGIRNMNVFPAYFKIERRINQYSAAHKPSQTRPASKAEQQRLNPVGEHLQLVMAPKSIPNTVVSHFSGCASSIAELSS